MIDTGAPNDDCLQILEEAIIKLSIDKKNLSLLLTHLHIDHAGLVDKLFDKGTSLFVSKTDVDFAKHEYATQLGETVFKRLKSEGFSVDLAEQGRQIYQRPLFFSPDLHDVHYLEDGQYVDVGSLRFEVLGLAGHTPAQLALWEPKSGVLFSGDHVLFDRLTGLSWEFNDQSVIQVYLESLSRLRNLPIKQLISSHDEQKQPVNERIDTIIERRLDRVEVFYDLIAKNPGANCDFLIRNMDWNNPFSGWEDIPLVQRFFITMEGICALDHLLKMERIIKLDNPDGHLGYKLANS